MYSSLTLLIWIIFEVAAFALLVLLWYVPLRQWRNLPAEVPYFFHVSGIVSAWKPKWMIILHPLLLTIIQVGLFAFAILIFSSSQHGAVASLTQYVLLNNQQSALIRIFILSITLYYDMRIINVAFGKTERLKIIPLLAVAIIGITAIVVLYYFFHRMMAYTPIPSSILER